MRPTDDLRSWAAAYREARQSPAELRLRIRGALDAAEEPLDAVAAQPPAGGRAWAAALGVGALLGFAALLLLSFVSHWAQPDPDPTTTPNAAPYERSGSRSNEATHRTPRGSKATTSSRETPNSAAAPVVSPAVPSVAPSPSVSSTAAAPPPRNAPADPGAQEEPDRAPSRVEPSTDLESLRRLRAAEALLGSDPDRARALVEAHVRDYPSSALALEREALWIRASCRAGGRPDLEQRRAAFERRSGVAAYLAAIAQDCGEDR